MRFTPTFLDEIRDRVPISSVIGKRVIFDKKKSNPGRGDHWACCPFHGEKSPSFHCEDRKGRYHCFGCGVSGDHFRFLVELEGVSFPEAVEQIAGLAGVPLPDRDPEAEKREEARASLHDVMKLAAGWFVEKLHAPEGAKARAYLRGRGLTAQTQSAFQLGYAPEGRSGLKEFLAGKGVHKDQIEACGLVVFGDDIPVSYDRFRDRIMFPIEDSRGRVIAFGGRAMAADAPAKYLNSPETELFHKGQILYNFAKARKSVQDKSAVIAVEGYMDVIALAQAGIANAVAPLGTALTENQLELLWRMAGEPVMCFDGDQAGVRAALRAADLALPLIKPGKSLRFAMLPDGKDPDDLVKAGGPEAFQSVLAEARPLIDMIWSRETSAGTYDTPERRAELEQRLRQVTAPIKDENIRRHYAQDLRERMRSFFGTSERPRNGERGAGSGSNAYGQSKFGQAKGRIAVSDTLARSALVRGPQAGIALREAAILMMAVNHPALIEEDFAGFADIELPNAELQGLHSAILSVLAGADLSEGGGLGKLLTGSGQGGTLEMLAQLVARSKLWVAMPDAAVEDVREAWRQALHLHHLTRNLKTELRFAESALAAEANDENFERLLDIRAQMNNVSATEALLDGFGVMSGRGSAKSSN
jgi:DNA primase